MFETVADRSNRLLIICGPTSTGKTSLALKIAKKFNAEILSADSRQVYKRLNIGTGKDLPQGAKFKQSGLKFSNKKIGYYTIGGIRVWGYDLVNPRSKFSVALYVKMASKILDDIRNRGKLAIIVGGTGLYINGIVGNIETLAIPQNLSLRFSLKGKSVFELVETLAQTDPIKAASLNISDRNNPRRLIRAIEIAHWKDKKVNVKSKSKTRWNILLIGLSVSMSLLEKRIKHRVKERLRVGIEKEIRKLLSLGMSWNDQSMDSLGYKEWKEYFYGNSDIEDVVERWERNEKNYAKRQMTWFRKNPNVQWFDISKPNFDGRVEKLVKEWQNIN